MHFPFLDEAPEFQPAVLQTLRQPLEHGEVVLHRASGYARYPARFQLVMAANPCPCGRFVGRGTDCTCRPEQRRRYFGRLSGPLLDRVDIQVEVPAPRAGAEPGEASAAVAVRVAAARAAAGARLAGTPWRLASEVPGPWLRARLEPRGAVSAELSRQVERGTLSLRGADRVLRLAWTLADLDGLDRPGPDEVGEALALRTRAGAA